MLKDEVNIQVLMVDRHLKTLFKPFCFEILVHIASKGPQIDQLHGVNRQPYNKLLWQNNDRTFSAYFCL